MKISKTVVALGALIAIASGVYAFAPSKSSPPAKKEAVAGKEHGHGAESVEISDAKIAAAGIEILVASKGMLRDSIVLNGILQPNQEELVQVTPRFSGVVREIRKRIGDKAEKGELLAKIESNQSLTVYEMRAPIEGTVIDRQLSLGEYASEQKPSFTIADLSTVWVDLSVYRRDLRRVKLGDTVIIDVGDGGAPIETNLIYVSPIGSSDSQSALVRAVVKNEQMRLRTGLFISARLTPAAKQASIVVNSSALQTLESRDVVFVRNGKRFEVREVKLGTRDADQAEVVSGLIEGDLYAAQNSFVVKAEMAKGGASHDH